MTVHHKSGHAAKVLDDFTNWSWTSCQLVHESILVLNQGFRLTWDEDGTEAGTCYSESVKSKSNKRTPSCCRTLFCNFDLPTFYFSYTWLCIFVELKITMSSNTWVWIYHTQDEEDHAGKQKKLWTVLEYLYNQQEATTISSEISSFQNPMDWMISLAILQVGTKYLFCIAMLAWRARA